jgi:hypothetical protein
MSGPATEALLTHGAMNLRPGSPGFLVCHSRSAGLDSTDDGVLYDRVAEVIDHSHVNSAQSLDFSPGLVCVACAAALFVSASRRGAVNASPVMTLRLVMDQNNCHGSSLVMGRLRS